MSKIRLSKEELHALWNSEPCKDILNQIAQAHKAADEAMLEMRQKQELWIKTVIREKAMPPIKGEITPSKLKWRGIKIVQSRFGYLDEKYNIEIWQRNELLGKVEVEFLMCGIVK